VAFFFLDDASRYGLEVVVGTAETSLLFLSGLREVTRHYGIPTSIYLDHGSGFTAHDSARVAANLGTLLIFGATAYPEGHGKIERFNQTVLNALLRGLDRRPDVDAECGALRLRLRHWLTTIYNHTVHESLVKMTPYGRFHNDGRALRFPRSEQDLDRHFMVSLSRRVSADHIVSVDSLDYEMPKGYAGQRVMLYRHVITPAIYFLDYDRFIKLQQVDLVHNARDRRAGRKTNESEANPLPPSAADLSFNRDFKPIIGPDGGFSGNDVPTDHHPQRRKNNE
ncbi:hypothetical protein ACFL27_28250, partial [candidate division CSSED10-310 bacterium]